MVSTPEQRRRYREKYPEKVKEQKRRYLERKLRKRIQQEPSHLIKLEGRLINEFNTLTRLLFKDKLPKKCQECESEIDLQIHHIRYIYPINKEDLKVLCRSCHLLEHQKVTPPLK